MLKNPKYLVAGALTIFVLALLLLFLYPYKIATLLPYLTIATTMTICSISILIASHFNSLMRFVTIASLVAIIVSSLPLLQLKSVTENIGGLSISLLLVIGLGLYILINQNKNNVVKMLGKLALVIYFILFSMNTLFDINYSTSLISTLLIAIITLLSLVPFFQKNEL